MQSLQQNVFMILKTTLEYSFYFLLYVCIWYVEPKCMMHVHSATTRGQDKESNPLEQEL